MTVQDHRVFCPGRGKLKVDGSVCDEPMSPQLCAGCFDDAGYFDRIYARTQERLAAVRRMRRVTVLSGYMKRELTAAGVAPERVHVIPPFVHGLDFDAAADGAPCVLFAGRLVAAKGADVAVEAWRRSELQLPLVVAGTGSERARLAAEGVEILGWVPHDRLASLYRRARAVVLPSRWQEPFGIVGLEALTLGVAVVAWDSGGVREWHPGPGLVPWGDVDALAGALRAAVESESSEPIGPRRSFDRDALMAQLRELYDS
jgi:glycosyltransferase involved in cell wall biosynthesis